MKTTMNDLTDLNASILGYEEEYFDLRVKNISWIATRQGLEKGVARTWGYLPEVGEQSVKRQLIMKTLISKLKATSQ